MILRACNIFVVLCALNMGGGALYAGPHDTFLGGPWEIRVQVGKAGAPIRFPLEVNDVDQAQALDQMIPVLGTSTAIRCEHYVPDIVWELQAVPETQGGTAVQVRLEGEGLNQQLWLHSQDWSRRSISSPIGRVSVQELQDVSRFEEHIQALTADHVVGVLTVDQREYMISPYTAITLPKGQGCLTVLSYLPHYSIDKKTKQVLSLSNEPVNPAVQIQLERSGERFVSWFWSRFSAPPHEKKAFPLMVKFTNVAVGSRLDSNILIVGKGKPAHLLVPKAGGLTSQAVSMNQTFPFMDARYRFRVIDLEHDVIIKKMWKNKSNRLLRPAVIGSVDAGNGPERMVLEMNKPCHVKTKEGTLVLVYQRQRQTG